MLLLCEHASNHVPIEYLRLGLTPADLERHIAWDIGAAAVTRRLAGLLGAPALLGTYSRLLIDLNRPLDAASSIVTRSEATDIPGNLGLDAAEARRRAERIFLPFHRRVANELDRRSGEGRPTRLVTIHSFSPSFLGVARPWHAGILFDRAEDFGWRMITKLRRPELLVGANVPYRSNRTEDYAVPIHGDDRDIPAILVEIRNDLLRTEQGVLDWADRLAAALSPAG